MNPVLEAPPKKSTERWEDAPPPPPPPEPPDDNGGNGNGGGDESQGSSPAGKPVLGNTQLAMLVLIAAEIMFFSGLIGAFLVFRFSGKPWPPPFQPRLPVEVTAVNTALLLLSSYTMVRAQLALKRGDAKALPRLLTVTGVLGVVFLAIQGYEWVRLVSFGLTASANVYGSLFYSIIGTHGFHVLSAVVWLVAVLVRAHLGKYSARNPNGVVACAMYWHLVVGLWPILFYLVYLL